MQLFNAINKQQKQAAKVADASESVKSKHAKTATKASFLEMLKDTAGGKSTIRASAGIGGGDMEADVAGEGEGRAWAVLQDDFMMGAQGAKDWDRVEREREEEGEEEYEDM